MSHNRSPEKREALSFPSLWQLDKEPQRCIIYIIIARTGWDLKRYPVSPKHRWPTEIAQFLFLRCTDLCAHTPCPSACLLLNKSNSKKLISFVAYGINSPPTSLSCDGAVNGFFFKDYTHRWRPSKSVLQSFISLIFFLLLQAPPPAPVCLSVFTH